MLVAWVGKPGTLPAHWVSLYFRVVSKFFLPESKFFLLLPATNTTASRANPVSTANSFLRKAALDFLSRSRHSHHRALFSDGGFHQKSSFRRSFWYGMCFVVNFILLCIFYFSWHNVDPAGVVGTPVPENHPAFFQIDPGGGFGYLIQYFRQSVKASTVVHRLSSIARKFLQYRRCEACALTGSVPPARFYFPSISLWGNLPDRFSRRRFSFYL